MSAPVQRRRVGLKCTESTLHGLLSFILWRPSWLGIYIPAPAVVPGLLALPFVGEPGKGWQGGKTPLPPRIPGLSWIFLGKWRQNFQANQFCCSHFGSTSVVSLLTMWLSISPHPQFLQAKREQDSVWSEVLYTLLLDLKSRSQLHVFCWGKSPVCLNSRAKWIYSWLQGQRLIPPKCACQGKVRLTWGMCTDVLRSSRDWSTRCSCHRCLCDKTGWEPRPSPFLQVPPHNALLPPSAPQKAFEGKHVLTHQHTQVLAPPFQRL